MNTPTIFRASVMVVSFLTASPWLRATDKANNGDALNLGSSWVGGTAPGQFDIATWSGTVATPANTTAPLSANVTWGGISVTSPAADVVIGAGFTITLNNQGINMSSATRDLTIGAGLTLLGGANQTWNIGTGRVLNINGTFTRSAGSTLNIQGAGTVASTTMANTSGILGPWATFGTGATTRYATISGGNVIAYTTGTAAPTAAGVTDTTGAVNYELAAGGAFGAGASFNTVRYTGSAATVTGAIQTNGILNVGGALSISNAVTIGAFKDLVVNNIGAVTLSGGLLTNSGGASALTKLGTGTLTLSAASTYTGLTTVNGGVLDVGTISNNALGSGGLIINSSAILQGNGLFTRSLGGTNTPTAGQIASQDGGFAARGGVLTLNFGGAGSQIALNTSGYVFGNNFIFGSATADNAVVVINSININSNNQRTFTVNSGVGGDYAELRGALVDGGVGFSPSGIVKNGTGLLVLSATNTYTGPTSVNAGTLQVGLAGAGSTSASSAIALNGTNVVLAGSGSVLGATTVTKGTIKPGDTGGASTGTLNTGSITFAPASSMIVAELQIKGSTGASTLAADKINITGNLTFDALGNSLILVNGTGYTATLGDAFTLLDWSGTLAGTFNLGTDLRTGKNSDGNEGSLDLPDISALGYAWDIDTASFVSGGALSVSVVAGAAPEPSRAVLLIMGLATAVMRRRRRAGA